jgi:DNA-binding CsgD family transcriptional regulator
LSDYEYGVFMMYADGDTPKKISARTGKNVKSVYNTIQRVRKKLENI